MLFMFPVSAATPQSFPLKERWSPFSSPDLQKPLLQVSYASSSSLPARWTWLTLRNQILFSRIWQIIVTLFIWTLLIPHLAVLPHYKCFDISYKVREPSVLQSTAQHRKRSTQSDTALLPTNVFFKTQTPLSVLARRPGSKVTPLRPCPAMIIRTFVVQTLNDLFVVALIVVDTVSQEKAMDRTLEQAMELARSMKRTTDRMAQRLSADLAKAQHLRKLHSKQPPGGRKHHSL